VSPKKRLAFFHSIILLIKSNFINFVTIMKTIKTLLIFGMMMAAGLSVSAQKTISMNLWQQSAPNSNGDSTDSAKIKVFLPDTKRATGRAVVICPGGGYTHLAMDHEGYEWAPFFNKMGIAVIVLKYRMPRGNCEVPETDAEEAIRIVRNNAVAWNIDVNQVGIMGFSAGGHLASTVATHAGKDVLPNFQILFYPVITMDPSFSHQGSHDNLLGKDPKKKLEEKYSNDRQISRTTPRAFIVLSDDDGVVSPINGVNYYMELFRHDIPATMHVYPTGGHGWGIHESFMYHNEMETELAAWLRSF
jgi:acetyl esterase/lipase